ncbi:MAG: ATP-dependent DNA helicase RecG [Clostridiales bacterium]|jgi:ATP-dependent DNA helicase RecG|nr:ATP-dependent DNA helicase RecG [Clostridiales bacterium]
MTISDNIENLRGVGAARTNALQRLGIFTIEDLITFYPRDYSVRTTAKLSDVKSGETVSVLAEVYSAPEIMNVNGKIILRIIFADETGTAEAVWFNRLYLRSVLKKGSVFYFSGEAEKMKNGRLIFKNPDYEADKGGGDNQLKSGRITPIYPIGDKIPQNTIRSLVKSALEEVTPAEFLPEQLLKKYRIPVREKAIFDIHFPKNETDYKNARRRLVFEELFMMQLELFHIKGIATKNKGIVFSDLCFNKVEKLLPFCLTDGQKTAVDEIAADFSSGISMNRLLQGDVGSGKTIIAFICAYIAVKNGFQVAFMAPTETLAVQHFNSLISFCEELEIKIEILSGSLLKKKKNIIKEMLSKGKIDILIGTHAIIQDNVKFKNLGFVITDEQHRFGVRQRAKLSEKGIFPHTLVMTATPIPRTLALILYGDLDISTISDMPPGRKKIETYCVTSSYRERTYRFILKLIKEGRQSYIVCPAIEDNETIKMKAVLSYTESIRKGVLSELNIACLHGKMRPDEKNEIMQRFLNNQINVLVATTVIEVGINVPNATIIVVENSERFGLAQLHQLRGRVGRGTEQSYCILITDSKNDTTAERMKAMTKSNDGFVLSELDLKLRGPGEFFGTKQYGLPQMKIANLYRDTNVLKASQEEAAYFFTKGMYKENPPLFEEIKKRLQKQAKICL